jgi:hypothetical protein
MYDVKQICNKKTFIKEIEYLKEEKRKNFFLRYSKILLINFSTFYIKEIWRNDELFKYSYYWLSADNKLILGWDNAPHHKEIKTYPYHRHKIDEVEPAQEKKLIDVLAFIEKTFPKVKD